MSRVIRRKTQITSLHMPNSLNEGFWGLDSIHSQKIFFVYVYKVRHLRNYMEDSVIEIHPSELVKVFPLLKSETQMNRTREELITEMIDSRLEFYRNKDRTFLSLSMFPTVGWDEEKHCFIMGIHKDLWTEVQTLYETYPYMVNEALDMAVLPSKHALKIYRLLVQYKNTRTHRRVIKFGDLRRYLNIKEKSYTRFADFNNQILQKAVGLINEKDLPIYDIECTFFKPGKSASIEKEIIFEFKYDASKTTVIEEVKELFPTTASLTELEHDDLENLFLDKCLSTHQELKLEKMLFIFRRLKGQYSIEEFQDIFSLTKNQFTKILDYKKYYDIDELVMTGTFILKGF